jgi:uncharacterized protein (TIGR02246 family)
MQTEAAVQGQSSDVAAIRSILPALIEAWDRGDGAGYASQFEEQSDFIAFDGVRHQGRARNASFHQEVFDTVLRGTRLVGDVEEVRFITGDVALLHMTGAALMPWQDGITADRHSRQSVVVVRRKEGWRIASLHNARIRPVRIPPKGSLLLRLFMGWVRLRTLLSGR